MKVNGEWKVTGNCTSETEEYYVPINEFFRDEVQWRAHLFDKGWFEESRLDLAVERYRAARKRKRCPACGANEQVVR